MPSSIALLYHWNKTRKYCMTCCDDFRDREAVNRSMGDKPEPDAANTLDGGKRTADGDLSAFDRETRKKTKVRNK